MIGLDRCRMDADRCTWPDTKAHHLLGPCVGGVPESMNHVSDHYGSGPLDPA